MGIFDWILLIYFQVQSSFEFNWYSEFCNPGPEMGFWYDLGHSANLETNKPKLCFVFFCCEVGFCLMAVCLVGYTSIFALELEGERFLPPVSLWLFKRFRPYTCRWDSLFNVWEIWCMVEGRFMYKIMAEGRMGNWRGMAERWGWLRRERGLAG